MDKTYEKQNPAFYAVIALLVFMSIGPVILMFVNSFKLDVDIISGTSGLLFLPTIQNYETALCDVLWYEPDHVEFCSLKFGGAFDAIIDLTPHELTRIHIAGAHVDMPARFVAGADVPRVVLPGAMNFIGLGQKSLVPSRYLERPHYEHSGYFTHVKVTPDEMELISLKLAESLNALTGPCAVIVPMGGFSHHDRPGDVIEDAKLRSICLETLKARVQSHIPVTALDTHLFAPEVTETIMTTLAELSAQKDLICTT